MHNSGNRSLFCYFAIKTIAWCYLLSRGFWLVTSGDKSLQPSLKHTSLQEDPSLAFEALEADIGAHPRHFPLVAAARMRFAHPDYVTGLYFYGH